MFYSIVIRYAIKRIPHDTVARFVESPHGLGGTVTAIKNRYFGGNVDVTGLIVACDILEQLPQDLSGVMLFVPKLMFNVYCTKNLSVTSIIVTIYSQALPVAAPRFMWCRPCRMSCSIPWSISLALCPQTLLIPLTLSIKGEQMKPIVAVVGRPNVGKSTLVNRLAQTSDAIVHESRGVTRDRSYHTADWNGREFTIVDTGGIEPLKSDDVFATSIRDQALAAAEEAAVILFVVDGRTGVTEEDESVARMLKRCDKPVFLLVNKLDNPDRENDSIWEFYSLGVGEPTPLSALHGHGTGDLLDDIVALLPEEEDEVADEFPDALNVAIIGRPNAGKSSLFNRILGADRSIVSNIAGTTRDAIDKSMASPCRISPLYFYV